MSIQGSCGSGYNILLKQGHGSTAALLVMKSLLVDKCQIVPNFLVYSMDMITKDV